MKRFLTYILIFLSVLTTFAEERQIKYTKKAHSPFNLGPTGILAFADRKNQSFKVKFIVAGSPAYEKVLAGDIIYGANKEKFTDVQIEHAHKFYSPLPQLGKLIEISLKTGKLNLMIKRGAELISVELKIQSKWSNSFPETFNENGGVIGANINFILGNQLPSGMWAKGPGEKKESVITSSMICLALMSVDSEKYKKVIQKAIFAMFKIPLSDSTWKLSYRGMAYSEYLRQFKCETTEKHLDELIKKVLRGAFYYNGVYGYGHKLNQGNYMSSGINICTVHIYSMLAMAHESGLKQKSSLIKTLAKSIEKLSPNNYIGYKWATSHSEKIKLKATQKANQNGIRTGMGAFAFNLLGGRKNHLNNLMNFLEVNEAYAEDGHASSGPMAWFWSILPLLQDKEVFIRTIKKWSWRFTLSEGHDGIIFQQPAMSDSCYSSATHALGHHFRIATDLILLAADRKKSLFTKMHTVKEIYNEQVASSRIHFNRMDRQVEIAEAINLLGPQTPKEVYDLKKLVMKVHPDDGEYSRKVNEIYSSHLEKCVRKTMTVNSTNKDKAALALIGINHDIVADDTKGKIILKHSLSPANFGDYQFSVSSNITPKNSGTVSFTIDRTPFTFNQKLTGGTERGINFLCTYTWRNMQFSRKIETTSNLKINWMKNVSISPLTNKYGPFNAHILKMNSNGNLTVLLSGVKAEYALPLESTIKYNGISAPIGLMKNMDKYDFNGSKCVLTYSNYKGSLTKAVCLELEILNDMDESFRKLILKASESNKVLRGRWVDGRKAKK